MAGLEVSRGTTAMEQALAEIEHRINEELLSTRSRRPPRTAGEMLDAERAHMEAGRRLSDLMTTEDIIEAHIDEDLRARACAEARARLRAVWGPAVEDGGWQPVSILLPGGLELHMYTRYLRPSRKGRAGRRRGDGKRGPAGAGCYPVLEWLGIRDGVTPMTRSEIARQTVLCSSYEEAGEQLRRQGLDLHPSTLTRIAVGTGSTAIDLRDEAMEQARNAPLPEASVVAGRRLRISVDGGRARTRQTRRGRGIRPGKNGRRPFSLLWKEPRIITIDMLDDEGETDRKWRPIYEVTLGDADETCSLLVGLLRRLGAHLASMVEFVADGANWMWKRIGRVLADARIPLSRVCLVLDYYHATEHISDALDVCKDLSEAARRQVIEELSGLLLKPHGLQRVVARLEVFARGRRSRAVRREIEYLTNHAEHMRYAELRAEKCPIGSGMVESAIRRIVNLRFKSASMCWRTDHLLPLLYLRAILKSGRWDEFVVAWLNGRHWLDVGGGPGRIDTFLIRSAA